MGRPDGEAGKPENEGMRPYPGPPGASVEFWQWLATLTDDDLLTMDEAAAMARMPLETFRHSRNHKRPDGFRMGKRVMFAKGDVRQWLNTMRGAA